MTTQNANTEDLVTPGQPEAIAKILDALPGMVGGIDRAIFDVSGKKLPFVLLIFGENGAMHATNVTPASNAIKAVKELAAVWDTTEPQSAASA
jgi:hypothetical protein